MSQQGPGNVLKVNELMMKEQEEIDIDAVLAERGKVHGDYEDHALYTQRIKGIIRQSDNYKDMSPHQRETLEMIAHKIGRILAGDPNHKDHWIDIAGYAKLTADRL